MYIYIYIINICMCIYTYIYIYISAAFSLLGDREAPHSPSLGKITLPTKCSCYLENLD